MTELDRARAHLRQSQEWLSDCRKYGWKPSINPENDVLAALSWLWEEQNRTDGDYIFPMAAGNSGFEYEWQ